MNKKNKGVFTCIANFVKEEFEPKESELVIGLYFGNINEKNYGAQTFCFGQINKEQQLMIAYTLLNQLKRENQEVNDLLIELLSIGDLDIEDSICQSSKKS